MIKTYSLPQTYAEALRALADEVESHSRTKAALEEAQKSKLPLNSCDNKASHSHQEPYFTFTSAAKDLGISTNYLINSLIAAEYLKQDVEGNLFSAPSLLGEYFIERYNRLFITAKGITAAKDYIHKAAGNAWSVPSQNASNNPFFKSSEYNPYDTLQNRLLS